MSLIASVRRSTLAALMMLGATVSAGAETVDPNDPPGRVGRLAYMEGTVSFRSLDSDQWVPATLNYPITGGDGLWTEPAARAEIQIGSADLRLDPQTAIQILRLDDGATRIQVDQGSVNLRLRDLPPGGVQIVTPRGTLTALQPGRYHVDMAAPVGDADGDQARFAVLEGAARVDGAPGSAIAPLTVSAGHSATLRGDGSPPLLAQAIARPLDNWALERERLLNPQQTVRYVSPEMTGHQDLDRYGQWSQEPEYGAIWYPRAVAADWAPYRYGHWAYVRPWGWTWIDHQPWGFAPFHYGRWVRIHNRWGWHPGTRIHRPVYAPALVAFVGGSNFSVTIVAGRRAPAVGWVPLGPREIYRPHYRHSPTYVRNVNITNVNVTNVTVINRDGRGRGGDWDDDRRSIRDFRNREALTVVSSDSFTRAESVSRARVSVRDDEVANERRRDSLDDLRPSRAARSGAVTPAAAISDGTPGPARGASNDDRQRAGRGERDDNRAGSPAERRDSAARQTERTSDAVPTAPGPRRDPRAARGERDGEQARAIDRRPSNDNNRPTVGSPERNTQPSPAPSPRAASPVPRPPRDTSARATPTVRAPGPPERPAAERGRGAVPDGRESRSTRQGREPDTTRRDEPRNEPRAVPRQIAPAPSPPRAGNDNALPNAGLSDRPARLQTAPPDSDRGQREPRSVTPAPQRVTPQVNQSRPDNREPRRAPEPRRDAAPIRAPQIEQPPSYRQPPQRESFERRAQEPPRAQQQPQRVQQPQQRPQRMERAPEQRRESRPQPSPQRIERPAEQRREARPQQSRPQEAQRPNNNRREEQRRGNGG